MKKQAFNPYLPSYEYVPDGEPRVFGDRVYVYGSHDQFDGKGFCTGDYVCWSAPVDDLSDWRYEGVTYPRINGDPLNAKGNMYMCAPDVVQGPDGRYYLYYEFDRATVTSVAVCDTPAGRYEYYGHVKTPDGRDYGTQKGEVNNFDPGVLVDSDGRVFLYTGFSPDKGFLRTMMGMRGLKLDGAYCIELEQDMVTMKAEPKLVVPGKLFATGTGFADHGFFEASSIRKIGGKYYFVYSSVLSHELCYAVSDRPEGGFVYGGTLISIGDIGYQGNQTALNYTGNTHGGMAEINGQWYIFYHRQTNKQKCCRQGCAEPITIKVDGSIGQAEMTSCGLNGGPLSGSGDYEARIACNLGFLEPTFPYLEVREKDTRHPYFTQSGGDREENGDQYIANMANGAWCAFKYFAFEGENRISIRVRGTGVGKVMVSTARNGGVVANIPVTPSEDWQEIGVDMTAVNGRQALYFAYIGPGVIDFSGFSVSKA